MTYVACVDVYVRIHIDVHTPRAEDPPTKSQMLSDALDTTCIFRIMNIINCIILPGWRTCLWNLRCCQTNVLNI